MSATSDPWYARVLRWGQVNFKEDDPPRLDVQGWVDYWRRTRIDGVTLNAGGGVAYYPTRIPLHRRARFLGEIDMFGQMLAAAKSMGLRVLGRLDPNFGHEEMYQAHSDWFLTDAEGRPRQRAQAAPVATQTQYGSAARDVLYSTCWNSPFHRRFMLEVMAEIAAGYDIDGFFTNGWPPHGGSPVDRLMICHCPHCQAKWKQSGHERLPDKPDPADPLWRDFVNFVQDSVEEVQALWRDHTAKIKPGAIFVWNTHGNLQTGLRWDRFVQLGELLNDDQQGRNTLGAALWESGRSAKMTSAVAEGRRVLRVFGTWQVGSPPMRHTAKPIPEQTLFMAEAVAHGQGLWFHTLGAETYDRRWKDGVAAYFNWHAENDRYFRNIATLADVALLWSPRTLWHERWAGDGWAGPSPAQAINGWYLAMLESRIAFDLLPEWKLGELDMSQYRVLVIPSVTCLDDQALEPLGRFLARGCGIVVCHEASLCDREGSARAELALAELLGTRRMGAVPPPLRHCYMRIEEGQGRHPLLGGLSGTEILPGATYLSHTRARAGTTTLTTLIPTYPFAPPEKVYMDPSRTDLPLIFCQQKAGRAIYFAMDLDAAYFRSRLPDHRLLMTNAIRHARGAAPPPLTVEGPGLLDVSVWMQESSLTVHLVNLNTPNLYGGAVTEIIPLGQQTVTLRLPTGARPRRLRLLRAGTEPPSNTLADGRLQVRVPQVADHEVLAVEL